MTFPKLAALFEERTRALAVRLGLWTGAATLAMSGTVKGDAAAESAAAIQGTVVHYVSETPYRWEGSNPLEIMARALSGRWGQDESDAEKLRNLQRQLNGQTLFEAASTGRSEPKRNPTAARVRQVFAIHGYEFCDYRQRAQLSPLLVAARGGKPAMTEFIVLCRTGEYKNKSQGLEFQWNRLKDKEILVDRGNCGELVYRWIDLQSHIETGWRGTELASLRNAESAEEAILAVYFREAEACIVARESYEAVMEHNRKGLSAKLETVCQSNVMLRYVAATSSASLYSGALAKQYMETARGMELDLPGGDWSLIPARAEHFAQTEEFCRLYAERFPSSSPRRAAPPATSPAPRAAGSVKPVPSVAKDDASGAERRGK